MTRGRNARGFHIVGLAVGILLLASCSQPTSWVDFTASTREGFAPLVVTFTPSVQGVVTAHGWDFGDGATSTEERPTHTYATPGSYTVSLTVEPASGSPVTVRKEGFVHVVAGARDAHVYWSERGTGTIRRGDRTGGGATPIVTGLISPEDIAVSGSRVYWVDYGTGKVESANIDGTGRRSIASGEQSATGIAVDALHAKVYWTTLPSGPSDTPARAGAIKRSNLDGSGVETLVTYSPSDAFAWQVSVDPLGGRLYWISLDWAATSSPTGASPLAACTGTIVKANLDGTHPVAIASGLCDPTALTSTSQGDGLDFVYFTDSDTGTVSRVNADGTGRVALITGAPGAESVAVDPAEGKMYWLAGTLLLRGNLDGSGVETIQTGLSLPEAVAIEH